MRQLDAMAAGFMDACRHPKKFQIAVDIISHIKSNNGRLYFDSLCRSLDLDQNTLQLWIYTLAGMGYIKKEGPGDYAVTKKGEFKLGCHFELLAEKHKMFLQSATV
jgi:predicted transcriptional regulator